MDSTSPFQPWATDDSAKNVKTERELVDDAKLHRENVNHPKHRQTASYNKESVAVPSNAPGSSSSTAPGGEPARGSESNMDSNKIASMQQIVENTLSQEGRQRVAQLLEAVEALSGAERLLLYLRLPTGVPQHDPLKQPINPLGSRAELQQTVTWIQTHLEVDPDVSLPKQDVYDEYIAHCMSSNMKPLSTADFGKVMKQVYPTVRPRRLGTRGNSRYCYAGLRKKIKLEVPQLPDLGESSKEPTTASRETERIVCDWAETKLGVKFSSIVELSRHLMSTSAPLAPPGPASASPPPLAQPHPPAEDATSRQLIKHLKRKIQTQGTPGRPKKNKGQEVSGESPPSTSYAGHHQPMKHESEPLPPDMSYGYQPPYVPVYDVRPTLPAYAAPPRAHPPHVPAAPHPALPLHEYRPDPYAFEPSYAPRDLTRPDLARPDLARPDLTRPDLTRPADSAHNLPINLSSDARDQQPERTDWQRRRPPEPPPARLPLPGKKLILETYHSETRASSPRSSQTDARSHHVPEDFPRTEYLPKKMRAAEILGGKLAAARQLQAPLVAPPAPAPQLMPAGPAPPLVAGAPAPPLVPPDVACSSAPAPADAPVRPEVAFLEDPKNLTSRSKSTAAALAREEQEAASPTRSVKAPTSKSEMLRNKLRKSSGRASGPSPDRAGSPERTVTPDSCCGLDGINIKTGMICEEKHSEILNRERVISICNIDKHDLDDYLNEGNSQEHEEELLQYFHQRANQSQAQANTSTSDNAAAFLEQGQDPHDDHSQGKNEKISQLRELLAKNLKNQSGSNLQTMQINQESQISQENCHEPAPMKTSISEGAFKPLATNEPDLNGPTLTNQTSINNNKLAVSVPNQNGTSLSYVNDATNQVTGNIGGPHLYNGHCHNEPQSPTTRTQQYEFVPISDGCHSPGNFHSKSPLGFGQRGQSPTKVNKQIIMGGSLQTSPISHSTAASPFVSPRNTPVPRSRLCPRPIPKHNGRKRRNPLSLGVVDPCSKQFAIPNDQKFMSKTSVCGPGKYCQPISAPPSPNIMTQYKNHMYTCPSGMSNGSNNLCLNFLPNTPFRDHVNGDQPLSADPLSSEVSQFFQESLTYRSGPDTFRSQSVPLKQGMGNMGLLSYNNTPVGSVPPTPVPNEFCDFGSLADTCDISKAGLNRETLDKIYDAIDSSNDVLTSSATSILNTNDTLSNGCDPLPEHPILSIIPSGDDLLERTNQFNQSFTNDSATADNVEDFLKRANSIEFDLSELVTEKNKYYTSRSVPSTPLPYKRTAPNLQIDSRRSRELFAAENYSNVSNGISSKSVPSTPQFAEDRSVFSYSNRDFLINGNSVCGSSALHEPVVDSEQTLTSPLHDMLREDILGDPLTPALLADLDKMDAAPYVDL
ncbi:unnamed protein product [Spodoptera littoralis]|uniref:RFX-type winged-helix domain-containing protein n=1 Tax=Spodoptera littoralis TaxID=7109 RepID=A0A9P0N5R2_SPOLI|nr:unnamed protein product [Spodoptera littoralis]CAH1643428.1 unnamed protein product [Spodoptera littoralis]